MDEKMDGSRETKMGDWKAKLRVKWTAGMKVKPWVMNLAVMKVLMLGDPKVDL